MPGSFGTRLRLRREEQGIPLSTIAEELKIKLSLLEAVERDDVSHWPSGIYRRAFIRAYAHAIALNPDLVVREFLELHPDPDDVTAAAFANATASTSENPFVSGGPPTRLRNIMGSALGSLSRLGRGGISQNPVAVRSTPIGVTGDADIPPMPVLTHREPGRVVTPTEVLAHRTTLSVPPLPPPQPPPQPLAGERPGEVVPAEVVSADVVTEPVVDREPAEPPQSAADTSAAHPAPPAEVPQAKVPDVDFLAAAQVCTGLACVRDGSELQLLLQEAAAVLGASGLIVWLWDAHAQELRPALVVGYSEKVLAQLPTVSRDADNPTAAAFRSAQPSMMRGDEHRAGALVVPLVQSEGCAGVLAMEFQDAREQTQAVHAVAMIFAAALSQLVGSAQPADAPSVPEVIPDPSGTLTRPLRVRR